MKFSSLFTYAALTLTTFSFSSCENFLNEKPLDFVEPKNFYNNRSQCEAATNGCYRMLTSIFNQNLMRLTEGATDLALRTSDDDNDAFGISPASPGFGSSLWTNCYKGVMYCNETMEGLLNTKVTEDIESLKGEVVFLRALYYYVLTSTFGDVPYYTDNVKNLEVLDRVAALPRMSAVETREKLISELEYYAEKLPTRDPQTEYDRISAQAAYMLIAKMAMWNKDYLTAKNYLERIRTIYGELSNYSLEDTWFRHRNRPESIFEVQFTWAATGLKKTSTVACFMTPSKAKNSDRYDGVSIPDLGSKASPYSSIRPTNYFISLYDKLEFELPDDLWGVEPRREMILSTNYDGKTFNAVINGGKPWMGPKFWCPGMDNVSDGNNQKVFRFADALLMLAECANELGDPQLALDCLKEIRMRAKYISFFSNTDQEALRKEIREERARELMGEYGRKWDLVRWGIFYDQLKATVATEYETLDRNLRPYHEYYPIPDTEVVRSGGILTNKAYKE